MLWRSLHYIYYIWSFFTTEHTSYHAMAKYMHYIVYISVPNCSCYHFTTRLDISQKFYYKEKTLTM